MVANYIDVYDEIAYDIFEMYEAAQIKAIESGKLNMIDDKSKEYFGTENFNNEFKDIINKRKLELKEKGNNFLFEDMFKEIGALQAKYTVASLSENENLFKSISSSIGDDIDEDIKDEVDTLVKYMAGMLGISEVEARKAIEEDPVGMANKLYNVQMSISENVKNGGSGYDTPGITTSFWEFKDAFYSTEAGQKVLFNNFLSSDSNDDGLPQNMTPYDEKNAVAYTNYITYCMKLGKLDWLMDSCKEFPEVLTKISDTEIFSEGKNEVIDADIIKQLDNVLEKNGIYAFGYVKKEDGKWYEIEFTERGQDMLYYMDYHCGENSSNSGADRVITAFSNQGVVDSLLRNYKGAYINAHIGSAASKDSSEYKAAARDFDVLNGIINDEKRYSELVEAGEVPFQALVNFTNMQNDSVYNLNDIDYINENKAEAMEMLGINEKQFLNLSVSLDTEGINTGNWETDGQIAALRIAASSIAFAGIEVFGGIKKYFENVSDSVNTALHSDLFNGGFDCSDEFREFRDATWDDFYNSIYYDEEYETFKKSTAGVKKLNSMLDTLYYHLDEYGNAYYNLGGKIYYSVDDIPSGIKEQTFKDIFKDNKLSEWDLRDASSSNYYLASFKEGVRLGGDFSRFDSISDKTIENAMIQFKVQDEVKLDETGMWMKENIYDSKLYNNYVDYSFVKKDNVLGLTFNQVGNMAIPILLSAATSGLASNVAGLSIKTANTLGKIVSSTGLFASAYGSAVEEAFTSGASYNEALTYATFSAATEIISEHLFSGISGYGEGLADDIIKLAYDKVIPNAGNSSVAKAIKALITAGVGESIEECLTDVVTPLWQSMTYMNEKSYIDIVEENVSLESLSQTAIISFLSSMIFKSVEINQQKNTFNKNYTKLTSEIEKIAGDKLDSTTMKNIADKVLGKFIEGTIKNEGVIPSGLLEQLVKTASNELLTANPEYAQELEKLQKELNAFSSQKITIGEGKNSISITGTELLKLEDFTGFNGNYTIEDGKIKFENEDTQKAFNDKVFEMAKNNADNYNSTLGKLVASLTVAKDSIDIDEISTAIGTITEFGKFADTRETVLLEHNGVTIQIPKAILNNNYITSKLSVEEGKIKFKKDMDSDKFIQKLYDKAIRLCNEKIKKNSYDIDKTINKELINKAIEAIKPALEQGNTSITVMNSTNVPENNLIKYDIKFNFLGMSKDVSVYVDANTDATALKQVDKINEMIQKAIFSGNSSNIYLGQLVYDSKTKRMNAIQDSANALYVKTLELETNKTIGNMYKLQNIIDSLTENRGKLENSEIVTIQKDGKSILIQKSLLEEITNKYKIVDGNVKFTKDMSVDKFISAVYDKAIDLNNQKILGIQNTNIKNATYVNTDGMDLYKLDVETIIDGETRTINVYVDGNTDISSIKNSTKISQTLYELILKNKNSNNVYAGEIVYNEKTDIVNVTENPANKLYVDSINAMSETDEHSEVVTDEEVVATTNENSSPSEEIKNGESYEYTIEEVTNETDSSDKTVHEEQTILTEQQEGTNNTQSGSESVISNITGATTAGVTAGTIAQAVYQNNGETTTNRRSDNIKDKNTRNGVKNKENIHVETKVTSGINISEIKSQITSYIDSIKTECEKYIEMHQKDENFVHRFEQFKQEKRVQLNDKLSEITKIITDSNNSEINIINEKINSLSEGDSLRNELISERDKLIEKQQQEIRDIENTAREKLQKVFSELNIEENAEPLGLTKDFVSTLTVDQKEFLAQISTEEGLIEYLQNNSLTKVELLERSELTHTDNKYVNKLIELISENQGTTKQIYNVEDVVRNNSNPIFIESTYKGDSHILSTNEVLDFMKTGKVDTKYSYSDYVKATNTLMNDLVSQKVTIEISEEAKNIINTQEVLKPRMGSNIYNNVHDASVSKVPLPKSINGIDSEVVYKYLTNQQLLQDLANNRIIVENRANLISSLKTMLMMKEQLGINVDDASISIIEFMYKNNIQNISFENLGTNVSRAYYEYIKVLNQCRGNIDSAIVELESMNYTNKSIAKAILTQASSNVYNYEYSRKLYDKSYDYLVSRGYTESQAAEYVGTAYREILDSRGYDTLISQDGIKIHVQKGICWYNQAYTLNYIQSELENIRKMYKTNIPVEVYVYDTFNPHDKYWSIQYKEKNFKSAATGGNGVINIYKNSRIDSTTLSHEYGHLLDTQIMKDKNSFGRVSESQEYLDAIASDNSAPTAYSTKSCHEDFAESIAYMRQNPVAFKNKFPNRYQVLSKYINVESSVSIANGSSISNNINVYEELNGIFKTLYGKYGANDAVRVLMQYVETGNLNVITRTDNARDKIANIDVRYIQEYLRNTFNIKFANTENQISNNIKNSLDSVFRTLEQKYGKGEAIKILAEYIKTGNINVITRADNARGIISNISMDDIIRYVNSQNNLYSPVSSNISEQSIITDSEKIIDSLFNDSESNSSSDTSIMEDNTMDFSITHDVPTTQDLELYKVVSKNGHNDLIISEELVEKFGQESIDEFIKIYEYISRLSQYIGKMDISDKTILLDIINSLNVDIESNKTLRQLKNLMEQVDGRHVFNVYDFESDSKLVMLPSELYTQYADQIDYLHKICSSEYSLKRFLENPDLKILSELKNGLFSDANFDPNTYYLIQRLYDASSVLLEDKVIANIQNFASKNGTELIAVDKETFELYKEELKQFENITRYESELKKFILNSSNGEILKLKNLFDEVIIETTDEFINKVRNIVYELSNGNTIVNMSETNWIDNPIIMSKDIYNLNKEIVDNVVKNIDYNSTLIKYLESVDVNTATKLKQLIDNGELVINTDNGKMLNKLINDIASGNKIINLKDVVYRDAKPLVISGEVYNDYVNLSSNLDIAIDAIYDIFDSKDLIYRLLSNNITINNVSNENIINSLKLYLAIAEKSGYSDAVINEIKYYLDIMSDTPQFIPSIFNGCYVKYLEIILNNPTKINGFTLLQKEKILKAVNEYSEFIKNNYPERYLNYVDNINALTRNVPKIDSSIAIETELYRMFENIGKIFGADQGAVRELLTRLKMNDVVQFLCGNKIEENNFMDTLNNMNFTEEQFKNALLEVNKESKSFLTDKNTFDCLKEQVMKNYPGMSEKDATQFLYLMEAYKDSEGICNYAATVNLIFNKYKNNPRLFEEHFGYPMYVTVDGRNELNTTMLLVDMYSIINDGGLVTNENGIYKVNTSNENYLNLSDNGKLNMKYFQKFLDRKGIKFNIEETYVYQSEPRAIPNSYDMMHYEEVIKNIHDCLARGEHVDISAFGFNLYKLDGTIIAEDMGGHIMTVVGITSDGNLIVDSWGKKLVFNLKEQMSNLGDVYEIEKKFGIERRRRVNIVSYNISLDNTSNISTNSNLDGNINNGTNTQTFGESINSPRSSVTSTIDTDLDVIDVSDKVLKHDNSIIEDADVEMPLPKKSIFSKKIETVSVGDIPRVFRNMNTADIISILEGKTTLKNDENFINNKKSIIRFVKYLSENNIKLSLNERANTIIENLRNGDFRLNVLNFSDVLNGDAPIYGPSSINLDGIKISSDDVMIYLENNKNEISSIITSNTPNEDARDLLNAIDELGSKNDIIYDKYRKSIKLIERIERSYVYKSYDSYYLLPKSFNGIDTSNILNSDLISLTSYINSLSNADKKTYRLALDEFGKYIYKTNTKLSNQDLSRVNRLYDVINTKKFSPDTVIKSKVYDTFEMSYQNDGEFGSNQGKVREVIEKLGITNVIESLFDEKVERSKFLQTLSEFNISERDFITALNKRTQRGIMNDLFKDGDINLGLYSSLIKQVKINYSNMSTMEAVRFLYLIETKEAGGPGICNNPILVNMIFDKYIGREMEFERDFGYPMYIKSNSGKKVLNEARLLVDIYSTLNDGVLVHNVNGEYVIETTSENYVRAYDLNGLRLDAIEKFIKKKGINLNLSKTYFFNSNEELMHYDYLMEQIKSELDKGNYVIFGGKGFDMDVENFEFRENVGAHGMTIVGIDTTGELILDSWGMKARIDLKKELSRVNEQFKNTGNDMIERIFTISSYNIN